MTESMIGLALAAAPAVLCGWLVWRGRRWPTPNGPEQYRAAHRPSGGWQV